MDAFPPQLTLRFAGYTLEPKAASLIGPDGRRIELRAKSFAVLCHLARNPARPVSRDALMDAIWPNVTVGEEAITQCVRDIRLALGDTTQRLVRTVPRQGYMLDAVVEAAAGEASGIPDSLPGTGTRSSKPLLPPQEKAGRAIRIMRLHRPATLLGVALAALLVGAALSAWWTGWQVPHAGDTTPAAAVSQHGPDPPSPHETAVRLHRAGIRQSLIDRSAAAVLRERDLLTRAVEADPEFGPAWSALTFTYTAMIYAGLSVNPLEDQRRAEAAAERGLALGPQDSDAYAALGAALRLRPERLEDALSAYRMAVRLSPGAHPARANVGWLLVLLGQAEAGESLIRATIAVAPAEHSLQKTWHYYLGMAGLLLNRDDHGLAMLREGLCRCGNEYASSVLATAAALALNGQQSEAMQLVAEARQRWPGLSRAGIRAGTFWPSRHPVFLEQLERVFEGLALAGMP